MKRTCINVFIRAWCIGKCSNLIDLGCVDPSVGIDCLPDSKQSIHIPVRVTFLVFQRRGRFNGLGGGERKEKNGLTHDAARKSDRKPNKG